MPLPVASICNHFAHPHIPMIMAFGDRLEVRPAEGMGQGLFATVDIPMGTRIVVEKPIMWLPQSKTPFRDFCQAVHSMNANLKDLNDLYCNARLLNQNLATNVFAQIRSEDPQNTIDMRDDGLMGLVKLYATYCTNAVAITEGTEDAGIAVFRIFSHINHSCNPNAFSLFCSKNKQQTVYAGRDIRAGQQILVSYFGGDEDLLTRAQRLEQTQRDWGFTCNCRSCLQPGTADLECERRMSLRVELAQSLQTWPPDGHSARQALALEVVHKAEKLLQRMVDADLGDWKLSPM